MKCILDLNTQVEVGENNSIYFETIRKIFPTNSDLKIIGLINDHATSGVEKRYFENLLEKTTKYYKVVNEASVLFPLQNVLIVKGWRTIAKEKKALLEITCLGVNELPEEYTAENPEALVEMVHEEGGITIISRPYYNLFQTEEILRQNENLAKGIDGYEVKNHSVYPWQNINATIQHHRTHKSNMNAIKTSGARTISQMGSCYMIYNGKEHAFNDQADINTMLKAMIKETHSKTHLAAPFMSMYRAFRYNHGGSSRSLSKRKGTAEEAVIIDSKGAFP